MFAARRKRSSVWECFKEESGNKTATCNLCSARLSHDGNVTNLKKHLAAVHPFQLKKLTAGPSESTCTSKQMKLTDLRKYPPSHKKQQLLDKKVVEMIVTDLQPVSMVEDRGFRELMNAADPMYTLPSRRTVMRTLIPSLYGEKMTEVKEKLQAADNITLTTDIWTSRAKQGYLGVTAHFFLDGEMMTFVLATEHFSEDHTGANIATLLMDIASEFGITDKVKLVVTDSAANMLLAVKLTPWQHLPCMAHLINLVVRDAQTSDSGLGPVIGKVKEVVGYLHRSTKANAKLEEQQKILNLPDHCLIQEVETRWNSTLEMIERALEQLPAINATLVQMGKALLMLNDEEVNILRRVAVNLQAFETVTRSLSGEKFATLSSIIPLSRGLRMQMESCEDGREETRRLLLTSLQKRFGKIEEIERVAVACLLDPRYKQVAFDNQELAQRYVQKIYTTVADLIKKEEESSQVHPETSSSPDNIKTNGQEKNKSLGNLLSFLKKEKPQVVKPKTNARAAAIVETDRFFNQESLDMDADPLEYWISNQGNFPHLYQVAIKAICAPATSVPSERLFSTAGDLICAKRARLNPQNVNKILFLNKNL